MESSQGTPIRCGTNREHDIILVKVVSSIIYESSRSMSIFQTQALENIHNCHFLVNIVTIFIIVILIHIPRNLCAKTKSFIEKFPNQQKHVDKR